MFSDEEAKVLLIKLFFSVLDEWEGTNHTLVVNLLFYSDASYTQSDVAYEVGYDVRTLQRIIPKYKSIIRFINDMYSSIEN